MHLNIMNLTKVNLKAAEANDSTWCVTEWWQESHLLSHLMLHYRSAMQLLDLNAPGRRVTVDSIEEHVHGVLYVDVQGGSLPPKPAANFSVSSDSCEFMWMTVGLQGSGLPAWNMHKRWESE